MHARLFTSFDPLGFQASGLSKHFSSSICFDADFRDEPNLYALQSCPDPTLSLMHVIALLSFLLLSSPLVVIGGPFVPHRTNVNENSLIMDPREQCGYYYNPRALRGLWNFPPTWKPAMLLANDSAGHAKWNEIKRKVPTNVPVKTLVNGSFEETLAKYPADDPDCWWTSHSCIHPKIPDIPDDIATIPPPLTTGYGFDDGPNCSNNAFYEYLLKNNQKATMFFVGSNVMLWPLEAQRALYDGHEICVHTWSHHQMTSLSSESAFAELWYTVRGHI
ncbi:hypothetical protein V5O48_002662 [Marasmius crinis-equi]|uniref:chitin deacetylase n=1 Tax=Marasmius crinis-equi TaxID=585013 RepID=A0ABR3FVI8_9AGAR